MVKLALYDPAVRHEAVERLVVRGSPTGEERKYWRFRSGRWYGGIVTADAVGCGLVCKYCWVSDRILRSTKVGEFYSPRTVAERLAEMARRRGLEQLRVSGGEPTIGKQHLLQLLENLKEQHLLFILETNGILLGNDPRYAEELATYSFLHARVSLKGCNEEEFSMLTDAKPEGFGLQLRALENLMDAGVSCHPAVMRSFSKEESVQRLKERLEAISVRLLRDLEFEELILYPNVKRKIEKHRLTYYSASMP